MKNFKPWLVCMSASLFFFYEFIQGNMFASIAGHVMADFHIPADKMSLLSSAYYIANVLFLFIAGMVLDHWSTKKTLLFAMGICIISTFILSHTDNYSIALLARFLIGIGSAFCFLGPVRLAAKWFPPHRMAMVTGVIVTFAMIGGMVAQYPLTKLVNWLGWRTALMHTGCLGIVLFFFMMIGIAEKSTTHLTPKKWINPFRVLYMCSTPETVTAALYTSLMNMAIAVFGAMMGALYLIQRLDVPTETAAAINTFLFLGAIIGSPLVGLMSDKIGKRILPMRIAALIALFFMIAILYFPMNTILMKVSFFCLGFVTSAQVISYAFIAETTNPQYTATAISIISIMTQGGYIIYQNLFGLLLTLHHSSTGLTKTIGYTLADYQSASIILPLGLFIAFVILFILKESTHHPHRASAP